MMTLTSVIVVIVIGFTHIVASKECSRTSCNNGATCLPSAGDGLPLCICAADYFGDTCQHKSSCSDFNPCQNNATCMTPFSTASKKTYHCQCSGQFVGVHCQYEYPCERNANPCKNGGQCHYRIDTIDKKAVQICLCSAQYKGDYCEQARCSISNSQCFQSLYRFPIEAISIDMDYQPCMNYGDRLIKSYNECTRTKQMELVNKRDCNCDPLETMFYVLKGGYSADLRSPYVPNPAQYIASHCLAAAYERNVTGASLPKCPQRTVQCFQCLLNSLSISEYKCKADPQADKRFQMTCLDDLFKGKLQYENCEFMQTSLEILAIQNIFGSNDGCNVVDHFRSCDIKYQHLQPCGLNYNELFTNCFTEVLSNDPECAKLSQGHEKMNDLLLKFQSSIDRRETCNKLSTFKDQIRSNWSCPANDAWDRVTYKEFTTKVIEDVTIQTTAIGGVNEGTRAVQTLVVLVTCFSLGLLL